MREEKSRGDDGGRGIGRGVSEEWNGNLAVGFREGLDPHLY